jgi:multiple sugar transport system ATP-binding protein
VYVTHDQVEAMTMGDRIAVLDGGVLQQYGRPDELYTRPVNLFVARFIGSPEMNLYEAAVDESGALVLGSQRISLGRLGTAEQAPTLPGPRVAPGRPVIVGVRPEDLSLCPDGTPGALTVDVRAVERLGSELHAFFSIDATPATTRAGTATALGETADAGADAGLPGAAHNGVARLGPRAEARPGGRLTLRVEPDRLYFFNPGTGEATGWPASQAALPGPVLSGPVAPGSAPAPALPPANALPPGRP